MRASWWRRPALRIVALTSVAVVLALWQTVELWLFPGPVIVSGRVLDGQSVIDGDTLKSANAEVRLYGIDAPELYQTCTGAVGKPWDCGRAAQAKLKSLVARKAVDCAPKSRDKFGRTVSVCYTSAVPDLGEALVREGLAVNFGVGDAPGPYSAAEADAQAAKRGVWRGSFDKPFDWRQANPREGD